MCTHKHSTHLGNIFKVTKDASMLKKQKMLLIPSVKPLFFSYAFEI